MRRIAVFANPISGRGRGAAIAEQLRGQLAFEGFDVLMCLQRPGECEAVGRAFDAAIVIGGDGTLRGVAQWAVSRFGDFVPPLLVVPTGTANLMGRHLGIRWHRRRAMGRIVQALRRPRVAWLDAATANGELMLLVAGVGIDAWIVHELDRLRRGPITRGSYLRPIWRALRSYRFPPLRVDVDGKCVFPEAPGLAFIGNVREYGAGFPLLPQARSDDGTLDVCVLPCRSKMQAFRLLLRALVGRHIYAPGAVYLKGRHIRVQSSQPVEVEVDGEAAGFTPLDIELLPLRVPFIVPPDHPAATEWSGSPI